MEGLAFCYSCINDRTPFIQLRAISNRVEKRNKHAWNIPLALENLNRTTAELLIELGK
jgi:futalosine hydrolase